MKLWKYLNTLLIFILLIAIVSSGYLVFKRFGLEANSKSVDVVLDSQDILRLSRYKGVKEDLLLQQFREAGASGILFKENLISDLEPHKAWVLSGRQVALDSYCRDSLGGDFDQLVTEYNYIVSDDKELYSQIKDNLMLKVHGTQYLETEGGLYLVGVPITKAELASIGLGFNQGLMKLAAKQGYNLSVQIRNWPQATREGISRVFELLKPWQDNISTVLFNDTYLPGFPDYLDTVNRGIKELGARFAFIETFIFNQAGAKNIGLLEKRNVVRMHTITAEEMASINPQRAVDRLGLAVTDRNVRVVLARMFFPLDTTDWLKANLDYIQGLTSSLEAKGFLIGKAKGFEFDVTSQKGQRLLAFLIGLGVIAGGMLLLLEAGFTKAAYPVGLVAALGWAGLFLLKLMLPLAFKLMALSAVVIFPTLAVLVVLTEKGAASVFAAISKLLQLSLVSLIGALLMVGLLADLSFMLKLDQFLGIKLAHVIPLLLLGFYYYFLQDRSDLSQRIKKILHAAVTYKYLLIIGFLLLAALVYLMRTGNEVAAVSSLELRLRTLLGNILYARPRTKEFLIGHPFMLLLLYLGYQHRYLPLLFLGVIGQISLVNTFAHVHTPFLISLIRTFNGLWLGILCGVFLVILWRLYKYLESRLLDE